MNNFDPYSPEFLDDPYPIYARLRRESPVFYDEEWGLTFFARHRDVASILKDRRFGRDVRVAVPRERVDPEVFDRIYPSSLPNWTRLIRGSFIDLEPPSHTRLRRLVQAAFSKRSAESYRPQIELHARALLDNAIARGEMEAIADYATPIPLAMVAAMLGVPEEDQLQLVSWSHAIVRVFDQRCTAEEGAAAEEAVTSFESYLTELFAERRQHPGEELIDALIAARLEGDRLTNEELIATAILVLNAGHEATVHAIGNALVALAEAPDQFLALREDSEAYGRTATEEALRFDSPLQMFERWVLEDLVWDGRALPAGSKVGLLFGSANRDEVVFDDPDRFDVTRTENPHVSFGAGIHLCVGAPLARIEVEVALAEFSRAIGAFSLVEEPKRIPSFVFRGWEALSLRLSPLPL